MKQKTTLITLVIMAVLAFAVLAGCAEAVSSDADTRDVPIGQAVVKVAAEADDAADAESDGPEAGDAAGEDDLTADDGEGELPEEPEVSFDPVSEVSIENAPDSVSEFLDMQVCDEFSASDYPASVNPSASQPFAKLSEDDIEAVYLQHPLVGSTKLTEEEVTSLVATLQALKTSSARTVASLWVNYDYAMRLYVVGSNGELWLLDARCDTYSDWLPMVIMFGDKGIAGFGSAAMKALYAVYGAVEARLNEAMPAEVAPFANLVADEVVKAEYFSKFQARTLSGAQTQNLIDLLTQVVIDPRTGSGSLPSMAGGSLSGADASNIQFRLTFANGRILYVGTRDGVVIGDIRYKGEWLPIYSFYQKLFK